MDDDDLMFEDLDYPDLDALRARIEGGRVEPAELRERLVELLDEMARLRFRFEVVVDGVERLPDVRGKLTLLDTIRRAQHGVPKRAAPEPVSATVETWEQGICFEIGRWDQLPLEDAMDALERIEDFAAKQVDAAIDRMQGAVE